MARKRWTAEDKARIVAESLTTPATTVSICKKYGLAPSTFYPWREKFLKGGRNAFVKSQDEPTITSLKKENADLRRLVDEINLAQDLFRKSVAGKKRVKIVKQMLPKTSLNSALHLCGVTKRMWYYKTKRRKIPVNPETLHMIQQIQEERPFYGTRRIAAEMSRRTGRPVNRKLISRIYKKMGWSRPARPKVPKARWKPVRANHPNHIWETDITYVWCGQVDGWCYCFNVLDIFTRQWLAYRFSAKATAEVAVESLVEAVATAKPDCSVLTIQCDNGSQYAGEKFRKATTRLGIRLTFIRIHTPEQNGHIESFHGTLKREYIWPHDFANYTEAEAAISEAFRDYNRARLHSALKYVPPDEFLASWKERHMRT